jgi:hypothetical protein
VFPVSEGSGYEDLYLVGYNALQPVEIQLKITSKQRPISSGLHGVTQHNSSQVTLSGDLGPFWQKLTTFPSRT